MHESSESPPITANGGGDSKSNVLMVLHRFRANHHHFHAGVHKVELL